MPRRQRGVILFVALIVMVAMTLTGIALMRSVDTNVLIAGNLAFRQGATAASDWGVETARNYLLANATGSTLWNDQGSQGYYASWHANEDFTGGDPAMVDFDWAGSRSLGADANGNDVQLVIHRICELAGDPNSANANCVRTVSASGATASSGGTKGSTTYGGQALPGTQVVYYRITVRVSGPRNTRSYVQAVLR
jgi:Tfp pilus assembly protein PilX